MSPCQEHQPALPYRRALLRMALFAPLAIVPPKQAASAHSAALDQVLTLDRGLLAVMKAGTATRFADRYGMLSPVVESTFDLREILRRCTGPRWNSLSELRQNDLLRVFQQFTVTSLIANFSTFNGQRFEVDPSTRAAGNDVVVETHIVSEAEAPSRLDYVLRGTGSNWRIVDVLLGGTISRVAVQRSDFRRFLVDQDASGLIASMQQKIATLSDETLRS